MNVNKQINTMIKPLIKEFAHKVVKRDGALAGRIIAAKLYRDSLLTNSSNITRETISTETRNRLKLINNNEVKEGFSDALKTIINSLSLTYYEKINKLHELNNLISLDLDIDSIVPSPELQPPEPQSSELQSLESQSLELPGSYNIPRPEVRDLTNITDSESGEAESNGTESSEVRRNRAAVKFAGKNTVYVYPPFIWNKNVKSDPDKGSEIPPKLPEIDYEQVPHLPDADDDVSYVYEIDSNASDVEDTSDNDFYTSETEGAFGYDNTAYVPDDPNFEGASGYDGGTYNPLAAYDGGTYNPLTLLVMNMNPMVGSSVVVN